VDKSKSIKALVTKVLGITVQRVFAAAASKFNAFDFMDEKQIPIRNEILLDIQKVLEPRGVTAKDTSFKVNLGGEEAKKQFDEALRALISEEHKNKEEMQKDKFNKEKEIEIENNKRQILKEKEKTEQINRDMELNRIAHENEVKDMLFDQLIKLYGRDWVSEIEKEKLKEEINLSFGKLKLEQLKEKVAIKGGPFIPLLPEIFKNMPRQFEQLNNVVLSDKALESIGHSPWQMALLQLLNNHLDLSHFYTPKPDQGATDVTSEIVEE
jgi:hypothetical protein